jgi:hypothetical protein
LPPADSTGLDLVGEDVAAIQHVDRCSPESDRVVVRKMARSGPQLLPGDAAQNGDGVILTAEHDG